MLIGNSIEPSLTVYIGKLMFGWPEKGEISILLYLINDATSGDGGTIVNSIGESGVAAVHAIATHVAIIVVMFRAIKLIFSYDNYRV